MKSFDNVANEHDDEQQVAANNEQQSIHVSPNALKRNNFEDNNRIMDAPVMSKSGKINDRIGNRERFRQHRNRYRQEQKIARGEEVDDENNNNNQNQDIKRNAF